MYFVMKLYFKKIFLLIAGLLTAIIVPAQDLLVLPSDGSIRSGILPNGTSYYVAANSTVKGVADFALIQKTGRMNIPDSLTSRLVPVSREALASMPRCKDSSVQDFFTAHGVVPGRDGFVRVTDNSTEYRFNGVLLSSPAVLDSALLVILDMIDRVSSTEDPFVSDWYAPSDQAVIVSGDVDSGSVVEKLKVMSLMTPSSASLPRKEYAWQERDTTVCTRVGDSLATVASASFTWHSARPSRENMNTVQPVIYEFYLNELGVVAENAISNEMRAQNIPSGGVSCVYRNSLESSGDETFTVSVAVPEEFFDEAVRTVAGVMSGIDGERTDVRSLGRVRRTYMHQMKELASSRIHSNSEYVDKCILAFLYNGSLSSMESKVDFLSSRTLADSTELRLFNSISSALLDSEHNLEISYTAGREPDHVRNVFLKSWKNPSDMLSACPEYSVSDIPRYIHSGDKVKLRTEKPEHMSGGKEWVFSNGFKVVYRPMDTGGRIYYDLALNGGYGAVSGLEKGEGGYVSDYFMLSRIGGIPADELISVLASEGVTMDVYTGLNSMMVSGSAVDGKLDLLMSSLLAVMNERETDPEAVGYYEESESVRYELRKGTEAERRMKINEIMCPDYRFTSHKMHKRLSPDMALKTERFFDEQSEKMNDGVLVLLGKLDEDALKKLLVKYVGGFRTTDRAFRRPLVRYQPSSGWSTYTVSGQKNSVDISMSVPLALTADNHMTAEISAMVLRKLLSDALADTGMYLTLSHECRIYPNERVNFHISLNETSPDGFSSDVVPAGAIAALSEVRAVLSGISDIAVSEADVEAFKAELKWQMSMEVKDPFYWMNAISRRYIAGKDFTTGYGAKIDAVTAEKVSSMLQLLNKGTRVEYIISGDN